MGKTKGEGRSAGEKGGHLVPDAKAAREKRTRMKTEERRWAEQSGPVETRRIEP